MGFKRKLKLGRDDGGYVTNEIPWGSIEQLHKTKLENGVEITLAVPTWAFRYKCTPAPGGAVWCGHGSVSLQIAQDGVWINELSEMNPIIRPTFDAGNNRISTLRFLSENDTWMHVTFYSKDESDPPK